MKYVKILFSLLFILSIIAGAIGCAAEPGEKRPSGSNVAQAVDLMGDVRAGRVNGRVADTAFIESMADFTIELFKNSISTTENKNSLISPLSVMTALSMTANGANGNTLTQMEHLLGGGIPIESLNEYLYSYNNNLPSSEKAKLSIANSIWFRDDESLHVEPAFLQINADYYNASLYKSAFDAGTLSDINNWVKSNTDGMIDKILDSIDDMLELILINAIVFDARWQKVYETTDIRKDIFTDITNEEQHVDFMFSTEYLYLDTVNATGFIKPYENNDYSFVALLPNENISINEFVASLTGNGFIDIINCAAPATVFASMPKFSFEYDIIMNDILELQGMPDAFNERTADFSKMATSEYGNIYIDQVLHKTFISVDELGTKAGAVTSVAMAGGGAPIDIMVVHLNKPFFFAIIDNTANLPIFMGTLLTV